jgi:outer membrane protein
MKTFLFILVLLTGVSGFTQTNKLTLQKAIETAIENNITVQRTELQKQSAEVAWRQSRSNILPSLNANASQGISFGRSIDPFTNSYVNQKINSANYGISSSAVLFNGLSLQNSIRQNAYSHEAAKMDVQQAKDNLILDVILAYLQIVNNEELVALAKNQVEVTRKQVERLQIMNREGAINPSLLSDLTGQLKTEELNVLNGENTLATSILSLTQLMNVPFDRSLQFERVSAEEFAVKLETTPDEVFKKAQELAIVKAADLRRKSAQAGLKALRGSLLPELSLNGGMNTNYSSLATRDIFLGNVYEPTSSYVLYNGSKVPVVAEQGNFKTERITYKDQVGNNIYSTVYLGLRIPLFNSFQTRNRIKLAKIEIKDAQLVQENTKLQLRQQVEQAHLNMQNALQRFKLLTEQVASYAESFRITEVRFAAGAVTSVDYLIAKNNVDRANFNLVIAKYDYILRRKVLEYLSGEQIVR